jgi:excisionase family DNA binding protein
VSDGLWTTRQVADYLAVSPETVLRRYRAGELPGIRLASNVLRFDRNDVMEWLEDCRGGRMEERATEPRDAHPARVVSLPPPNPFQGGTDA